MDCGFAVHMSLDAVDKEKYFIYFSFGIVNIQLEPE